LLARKRGAIAAIPRHARVDASPSQIAGHDDAVSGTGSDEAPRPGKRAATALRIRDTHGHRQEDLAVVDFRATGLGPTLDGVEIDELIGRAGNEWVGERGPVRVKNPDSTDVDVG
jgi:hypothetical protein